MSQLVPCGPTAQLFVMIVPCAIEADKTCWDPVAHKLPESDCGEHLPFMPLGYCMRARPTGTADTFVTAAFTPPGASSGQHVLASVYWRNTSEPAMPDFGT